MVAKSTGAACSEDLKSEATDTTPKITTPPLAQIPSDLDYNLNAFLDHGRASDGQDDRPLLGFGPIETPDGRIARVDAQLQDFEVKFGPDATKKP